MKPITFLAALLVLVSFTLPWVHVCHAGPPHAGVIPIDNGGRSPSFISLIQKAYSASSISAIMKDAGHGRYAGLIYSLGLLFVGLGAIIAIFNRAGHFVGILGLVMVSYLFLKDGGLDFIAYLWNGSHPWIGISTGYIITWFGFIVGACSGKR